MKRLSLLIGAAVLAAVPLFGQIPAPRFEIAGVQVSTRPNPGMRGGVLRDTRYELRNASMVDLIRTAYDVIPEKITGGPAWLEWNRYDIAALAPAGSTPAQLRTMLKTLLADRFKLVVREDMAATTAMALKVAGSPKLRQSSGTGGCQGQGAPDANGIPLQTATCKGLTMAALATELPRMAGAYFPGGQTVVDETGLAGSYDFELKWHARALLARAGSDGITIEKGLAELGLKLEPKEIKVPAIVVESVTAEFTPDPADLARRMPPLPSPQFEVAEVKLSPPEATQPRAQLLPTGQITASGVPLNLMINLAWDLPNEQFIVGPNWLSSTRYELIARVYANAGPNANVQQDEDIARKMLQALIVDRFKMKYHMEDRPMPAYDIKADTIKMTKADPTKRTRCFEGAATGTTAAARPQQFGRQVTCQNITMAQFGKWLPSIAGGYTRVPARDLTGLTDGYDFTLNFSPIGQVQGPRPDAGAGGAAPGAAALDPTGALSLLDAVKSQLGIRLEEVKRPLPVLVIDSISEKPTDN
jgi:uncharacterized protein (TIGR03435 family)